MTTEQFRVLCSLDESALDEFTLARRKRAMSRFAREILDEFLKRHGRYPVTGREVTNWLDSLAAQG